MLSSSILYLLLVIENTSLPAAIRVTHCLGLTWGAVLLVPTHASIRSRQSKVILVGRFNAASFIAKCFLWIPRKTHGSLSSSINIFVFFENYIMNVHYSRNEEGGIWTSKSYYTNKLVFFFLISPLHNGQKKNIELFLFISIEIKLELSNRFSHEIVMIICNTQLRALTEMIDYWFIRCQICSVLPLEIVRVLCSLFIPTKCEIMYLEAIQQT